jgi:hypothetical protein
MSRPVEVSRGRYVNLSGEPPTPEELLKEKIRKIIFACKFQHHALDVELRIAEAVTNCKEYRDKPYSSYKGKKVTRQSFGTSRPEGRKDQELIRFHLISVLWASWLQGMQEDPVVNNKGNPRTPFVNFVDQVFQLIGIGKVEDHLEDYESYRQATFSGQTYAKWKNERERAQSFRENPDNNK